MIGYIMIGTNDLPRATAFYDEVLRPLGAKHGLSSHRMQSYNLGGGAALGVCLPYDGRTATHGNGNMYALMALSQDLVREVHALAIAAGGQCEGPPGLRREAVTANFYGSYFRDLDGNKVCVFTRS
ncbi:hypothetical protein AWL63_04120 [Sphingomonas panacis]|uniref:VOC domain-containing protein n=1 Tax=Sphingomonas panacis TaxID=1560345 RepID=A0A1B3Z777_9SPHN|nr:VOC family protein [Sphingomonas panacis]AOH83278.1 hypothetical protein AWL63_04120 [Sphingomonas panacis]